MGSLSIWHWLIVLVIVMLIFGTKKLRNIGADLGGAVRGFKDGMRYGDKAAAAGAAKLPRVARSLGHLAGRLQRYVADVKADSNREIELDELRKMRDSMQKAASDVETSVNTELAKTADELNQSVAAAAEGKPPENK